MNPQQIATFAALLTLAAAAGAGLSNGALQAEPARLEVASGPAADQHAHDHDGGGAASHDHASHEERPAFPLAREDGVIPDRADAASLPVQLRSFTVRGDDGLREMVTRGYIAGSGTIEDPFVIEGFRVRNDLSVQDTSLPLVIRGSIIEGQLRLNYVGNLVYVHHNRVHDLRVNENIARSGDATAGLFEHNAIAFIGQIRHYSGEFAHNTVGPRPDGVVTQFLSDSGPRPLEDGLVWNFDGYHGALVHDNEATGRVDVKLHGHYHGSCLDCIGHQHDEDDTKNHSARYHALRFENNRIRVDDGVALRFYDRQHAGDDRTAASEPNPKLQDPHAHTLQLEIRGNVVEGGSLVFDVLNAEDERHVGEHSAHVIMEGNLVTLPVPRGRALRDSWVAAYVLQHADGVQLDARANRFELQHSESALPGAYASVLEPEARSAGFLVHDSAGGALVAATQGRGADYGVALLRQAAVELRLEGNRFNAKEEIHRE